jgi:hypothetical protein
MQLTEVGSAQKVSCMTKPAAQPNGGNMRLIPRHRQHQRSKALRIAISEEEIAADLHYPARQQPRQELAGARRIAIR